MTVPMIIKNHKSNIISVLIELFLIAIFIGALSHKPYEYYQNLRSFSFFGFLIIGCLSATGYSYISTILCLPGIVIFNPLVRFYYHRNEWQNIDKLFIGLLLVLIVIALIKFKKQYKYL